MNKLLSRALGIIACLFLVFLINFSNASATASISDIRSDEDIQCGATCYKDGSCSPDECASIGCTFYGQDCVAAYETGLSNGAFCYSNDQCSSGNCSNFNSPSYFDHACCPQGSTWDRWDEKCTDDDDNVVFDANASLQAEEEIEEDEEEIIAIEDLANDEIFFSYFDDGTLDGWGTRDNSTLSTEYSYSGNYSIKVNDTRNGGDMAESYKIFSPLPNGQLEFWSYIPSGNTSGVAIGLTDESSWHKYPNYQFFINIDSETGAVRYYHEDEYHDFPIPASIGFDQWNKFLIKWDSEGNQFRLSINGNDHGIGYDRMSGGDVQQIIFMSNSWSGVDIYAYFDDIRLIESSPEETEDHEIKIVDIDTDPDDIIVINIDEDEDSEDQEIQVIDVVDDDHIKIADKLIDIKDVDIKSPFSDMSMNTIEGVAAAELYYKGIITGYSDGEFKGGRLITRAEAVKYLVLARYGEIDELENDGRFSDVEDGKWYTKYIIRAADKGMVNGYFDGTFKPEQPVSTAEFVKMLTVACNDINQNLTNTYSDVFSNSWFYSYAGIAQKYKLFPKRSENFLPYKDLTRKEVAVAIFKYIISVGAEAINSGTGLNSCISNLIDQEKDESLKLEKDLIPHRIKDEKGKWVTLYLPLSLDNDKASGQLYGMVGGFLGMFDTLYYGDRRTEAYEIAIREISLQPELTENNILDFQNSLNEIGVAGEDIQLVMDLIDNGADSINKKYVAGGTLAADAKNKLASIGRDLNKAKKNPAFAALTMALADITATVELTEAVTGALLLNALSNDLAEERFYAIKENLYLIGSSNLDYALRNAIGHAQTNILASQSSKMGAFAVAVNSNMDEIVSSSLNLGITLAELYAKKMGLSSPGLGWIAMTYNTIVHISDQWEMAQNAVAMATIVEMLKDNQDSDNMIVTDNIMISQIILYGEYSFYKQLEEAFSITGAKWQDFIDNIRGLGKTNEEATEYYGDKKEKAFNKLVNFFSYY
ncbi:S-layer homology domain-containing protein [Patescibacteria group bacterium]|nr:S-layer homology domain-containing protein [Patescibacteria group bacterium]